MDYVFNSKASYTCDRIDTRSKLRTCIWENFPSGIIHFRGLPGCGKTTLIQLLTQDLVDIYNDTRVIPVKSWPPKHNKKLMDLFSGVLKPEDDFNGEFPENYVILIDDAHQTYDDVAFWTEFLPKITHNNPDYYRFLFVLFSSFSSPVTGGPVSEGFVTTTQLYSQSTGIPRILQVPLFTPDNTVSNVTVGLFFTYQEFVEVFWELWKCCFKGSQELPSVDLSALEYLWELTQGHPGLAHGIIKAVARVLFDQYVKDKKPIDFRLERVQSMIDFDMGFWQYLKLDKQAWSSFPPIPLNHGSDAKGDMEEDVLLDLLSAVKGFRAALGQTGSISLGSGFTERIKNALPIFGTKEKKHCWTKGWLYMETTYADPNQTVFAQLSLVFPTRFHAKFAEKFVPDGSDTDLASKARLDIEKVLRRAIGSMRYHRLQEDSLVLPLGPGGIPLGGNEQDPLLQMEARVQYEFRRALKEVLKRYGSTATFEWAGSETGRATFYVPDQKWGIEVMTSGAGTVFAKSKTTPGSKFNRGGEPQLIMPNINARMTMASLLFRRSDTSTTSSDESLSSFVPSSESEAPESTDNLERTLYENDNVPISTRQPAEDLVKQRVARYLPNKEYEKWLNASTALQTPDAGPASFEKKFVLDFCWFKTTAELKNLPSIVENFDTDEEKQISEKYLWRVLIDTEAEQVTVVHPDKSPVKFKKESFLPTEEFVINYASYKRRFSRGLMGSASGSRRSSLSSVMTTLSC